MRKISLLLCIFLMLFTSSTYAAEGHKKSQHYILGQPRPCANWQTDVLQELYSIIFARAGATVELKLMPRKRIEHELTKGTIDGDFLRAETTEFLPDYVIAVPEPVFHIEYSAFARTGRYEPVSGNPLTSYDKLTIAYVRGSLNAEMELARNGSTHNPYPVNSYESGLGMLNAARLDMFIGETNLTQCVANNEGYDITRIGTVSSKQGLLFLQKKHAAFAQKLAVTIREMKREGSFSRTLNELIKKHSPKKRND